jgi:hypothetical protein
MTDRELLEKAALAADCEYDPESAWPWNPLEDDGQALRLAVKLRIVPACGDENASVYCEKLGGFWCINNKVPIDGDRYAATRRAIVRAAAAIGEVL